MIAPDDVSIDRLAALTDVLRGRRTVVLSGAGCSTESGIPDYRGPQGTLRRRAPMQYGEFVKKAESRTRYWARSAVGWARVDAARPNACHLALARLEKAGVVRGIITQNVDGLHAGAGSRRVIELHGSLSHVRCLECGERQERRRFQELLRTMNAGWMAERSRRTTMAAPDGDAELHDDDLHGFRVPGCPGCGGTVKPDVVFFGETVPAERVAEAWSLFDEADVLLVAGSSLTVYSGRRFIYRAQKQGVPIAVVNLGPTRADELASVKVDGRLGAVLPRVADALAGPDRSPDSSFQNV